MRKTLRVFQVIFIGVLFFALGSVTEHYRSKHPIITTEASLQNPKDALTAIRHCNKTASWKVTLKVDDPLTLELLTCPNSFHPKALGDPDDNDGWPAEHQVLLLERNHRWHTEIVSALYAELNFRRVEPGKITDDKREVVLWSSMIRCGSCHSGPEGILVWNDVKKRYDWNASWLNDEAQVRAIDAALPDAYYLDEAESLFWDEDRSSLYLQSNVHAATDAHCCPTGGTLSASINVRNGSLTLSDISYQHIH